MRTTILSVLAVVLVCNVAWSQIKMGVIGDSLIDEHFDQTEFFTNLGYSKNALELLIDSGQIDCGTIGNWGGTRGSGYQYNWALAGSTTTSLILDFQHINLADQIPTAGIEKAVVVVGANDLFPFPPTLSTTGFPGSNYEFVYEDLATPAQIDEIATAAVANVLLAAQTLQATGVDVIVATAPDYGISPFCKALYPDPVKRENVDVVIESWNANATTQLTDNGITVVDIYSLSKMIWGDHGNENNFFQLGGVNLDLNGTGGVDLTDVFDNTYNPMDVTSDTIDAFVHDGIHPNTTIGGIFANLFVTAFNQRYCDNFLLFSEQEILSNAGPGLGAMYDSDTFEASLNGMTYSDFVIEPEIIFLLGDVDRSGAVNLLDVNPFIEVISSGMYKLEADTNEDGLVNLLDVDPFVTILSGG